MNPLKAIGKFVLDKAKQAATAVKDYVMDVVTGKKLMEGLNDQGKFFDGWVAHGSAEIFNTLWKGEIAPMYAHSPPEPLQNNQVGVQPPAQETEHVQQSMNVANELMDQVKAQANAHYQVDKMELGHMTSPEIPDNHISLNAGNIAPPVQQGNHGNHISIDAPIQPEAQVDNQISMEGYQPSVEDMQIDHDGIEQSEPITPEPQQQTEMEM